MPRRVTKQVLNRTLLQRQHLLERTTMPALEMVAHLLGLQAQDVLPPYLSLHARLAGFDPLELSGALERREAVRLTTLRGTIHVHTARDAATLRAFTQPYLTKSVATAAWGKGFPPEQYAVLAARTRHLLADAPLPGKQLGEALATAYPDRTPSDCTNLAKSLVPLVQLPPRGLWGRSGGIVYDTLDSVLDSVLASPLAGRVARATKERGRIETPPAAQDLASKDIVRRYLRAYGPATPADVTTWSGVTGVREAFSSLGDELVRYEDEDGKPLWDLAELPLADADAPAPPRLLGVYDNLWLSHAGRDRVTAPEDRARWMGRNGGLGATVFVGGWLAGLWRRTATGRLDLDLFREVGRAERVQLDVEVEAVDRLTRP